MNILKSPDWRLSDLTGVLSTSFCLVHCIAAPVLVASGFYFLEAEWLKYVFIVTSFLSIYFSLKEQPQIRVAVFLWLVFFVFLFSMMFENKYPFLEYTGWGASVSIIIGHIWNFQTCRRCNAVQQCNTPSTETLV